MTESKLMRPAPINKTLYIKFGNKCRTNHYQIKNILEKLCLVYVKKGEDVFKD